MPDVLSGLIWVQIVCKCNQQTTLLSKELMTTIQANYSTCADPGIFVRGGGGAVQVNLTKKALTTFFFFFFFFSPQLILQKSNGHFQRNLSFFKSSRGGPTFSRGGGSNCLLIPYRDPYDLWFSRGVRTPCPPSGSTLVRELTRNSKLGIYIKLKEHQIFAC